MLSLHVQGGGTMCNLMGSKLEELLDKQVKSLEVYFGFFPPIFIDLIVLDQL